MATTSVDGLVSGLDTAGLIAQLMRVERAPQDRLKVRVTQTNALVSTYQGLNSRFAAITDAAKALTAANGFEATSGSSSDSTIAAVTAKADALPASLTFTVDRLATANALASAGTVNGTAAVIATPGSKVLIGATRSIGVGMLASQSGLSTGEHALVVTQATGAASHDGSVLGASITIGAGATLEIATDGGTSTTQTVALTAGTYTRAELATMVTNASGGSLAASVDGDGSLKLSSTAEGSTAKLAVTGGTALGSLGFAATSVASGTDGIVTLDGVSNTVTAAGPGVNVTFSGTSGATLAATLSGGLRTGTSRFALIDVGDGSLASVVTAVNGVAGGATASAVQVGAGLFRLQLSARATGLDGALSIDPAAFTGLGTLETLTAAQDARLTVGSGPTSYTITSASNDAEILAGVSVKLLKTSTTPVTVDIRTDAGAVADKVGKLVDGMNAALSTIRQQSSFDTNRRVGGPLLGDSMARQLAQQIYSAMGGIAPVNGLTLGQLGMSVNRDGTIAFDRTKFQEVFVSRPTDVRALLGAGAPGTPGLAKSLQDIGTAATDSSTGLITTAITGTKSLATSLGEQVTAWDNRLLTREKSLRRQYGEMESRLGSLRNQGSWLSGQLANLPKQGN